MLAAGWRRVAGRMPPLLLGRGYKRPSGMRAAAQDPEEVPWDPLGSEEEQRILELNKNLRKLLKGTKRQHQYVVGARAAATLVGHLRGDLQEGDTVVEMSPGLGVLTQALLSGTQAPILAYEPKGPLKEYLEATLVPHHPPSTLTLLNLDMHKFYGYYIVSRREMKPSLLASLLTPLPPRQEPGGRSRSKIVGVVGERKFFSCLTLTFALQCCFYENIFPHFYLFLPHDVYSRMSPNKHRSAVTNRLFHIYFDVEELETLPSQCFFPPPSSTSSGPSTPYHLIKITPSATFFSKVSVEELESFHFFMMVVLRVRLEDTLIGCLERWIPDCGPDIIKNGIRAFAHPKELSHEQLLLVFDVFTSHPSFPESIFHHQRREFVRKFGAKVQAEEKNREGGRQGMSLDLEEEDEEEVEEEEGEVAP